jgi:Flp pilus assembly protein TadD
MNLADKGLIDEPIEQLRKVIELLPANTVVRNNLAALLLQKGQAEQAIAEYEQVLKIDPADMVAHEGLNKAKEALVAVPGGSQ